MAAKNGVWVKGMEIESHRMRFGDRLVLAGTGTELEWQPVH